MSDLEKFEQLFKELGIKYSISNKKLSVDINHIYEESYSYGKALDISFLTKESFFILNLGVNNSFKSSVQWR